MLGLKPTGAQGTSQQILLATLHLSCTVLLEQPVKTHPLTVS